eukprot:scaffold9778_cov111-Isochrysis_galbana.AAC.1
MLLRRNVFVSICLPTPACPSRCTGWRNLTPTTARRQSARAPCNLQCPVTLCTRSASYRASFMCALPLDYIPLALCALRAASLAITAAVCDVYMYPISCMCMCGLGLELPDTGARAPH